jgi:mannose-6-phosphate isomerase-like protein (cupin superfamily)
MNADDPQWQARRAQGDAPAAGPLPGVIEALIGATGRFVAAHAPSFLTGTTVPWSDPLQRRTVEPASLPVVRHLAGCLAAAPPAMRPLVGALQAAAPALNWRQTYNAQQMSPQFLEAYGWTELAGLAGAVPSRTCAVGFLILGPGIEYPSHHHEALELYVTLAGRATWWQARSGWQEIEPGATVRHAPWEPHAMRTHSEPLLALYLWRSGNLDQHAELTGRGPAIGAHAAEGVSAATSQSRS